MGKSRQPPKGGFVPVARGFSRRAGSAQAFDEAANRYDADAAANPMMRWLRRESLRRLLKSFKPGDFVLEIGCGTGDEALALARRGVRMLATDASDEMIKVVRRKKEK